ncbi:MAG: radical SAM protein [Magnetococcales bacterium]|nr:radical SAM protein [Magnetococcales bacterium]
MKVPNIFSASSLKLASFPEHIKRWRQGWTVPPITLEIQPSERCNHSCPKCQGKFSLPADEVRFRAKSGEDLDLNLLQSIWEEPPQGIVISGNTGEPLLYPHLIDLLKILHEKNIPTIFITNGEKLTSEIALHLVKTCRGIRISLDAGDPINFFRTHGRIAQWEVVNDSIRLLLRKRAALCLSPLNCRIGIGYLTDEKSISGMSKATMLACDLGVDYIQFRPYHYNKLNISDKLDDCVSLANGRLDVISSSQKYDIMESGSRNYRQCHGSNFYSVLDARGDIYICCHHIGNAQAVIGSLGEKTWKEIIYSKSRYDKISTFDVSDCLPFCRLNAHNETLEEYRSNGILPSKNNDPLIQNHAVFL